MSDTSVSGEASPAPRHAMRPASRFALVLVAGVIYAAALPPLGAWPLAWMALAPFCLACTGVGAARGAILGLTFGGAAAALTSPWFPAMIGDYFDQPGIRWPLAVFGWILCGALYHAALGAWLSWADRSGPVSPLLFGAMWWTTEWARANAPIANPWALLGYSQIGFLPAAQIAELVGPHGVGAMLAAAGAAVACGVAGRFSGHLPDGRASRQGIVATAAIVVVATGYGFARLAALDARDDGSESRRALLVQGALPRKNRTDPQDPLAGLDHHLELTARGRSGQVDLVVWPELALDFYPEHDDRLRHRLVSALASLDVDLMTGAYGRDATGERPTNAVFLVNGRGLQARYDKVRLMVFSETGAMAPGDRVAPMQHGAVSYGLAICSEAMHAPFVAESVRAGAEVLIAPTVDSWFGSSGGKRQQLEAVAMRAIETRRFVLRPTASGITAAIDPGGRITMETPIDVPFARIASYSARHELTPYVRFGDVGVVAAAMCLVVDAARRRSSARTRAAETSARSSPTRQAAAASAGSRRA